MHEWTWCYREEGGGHCPFLVCDTKHPMVDVLFHPELPPELVNEILARCDAPALGLLARLNREWAARIQPLLEALLTRGIEIMLLDTAMAPTYYTIEWYGRHTVGAESVAYRGLRDETRAGGVKLQRGAGHSRDPHGVRLRHAMETFFHACHLDDIVNTTRGRVNKVNADNGPLPWPVAGSVPHNYVDNLLRLFPKGALLACFSETPGYVFVHDYPAFMDECRRVYALLNRTHVRMLEYGRARQALALRPPVIL